MVGRFEAHVLPDGSTIYYDPDPAHAYYGEIKPSKTATGGYSFTRSSRLTGVSTIAKYLDASVDPLMHWAVGLDHVGIAELVEQSMKAHGDLTWLTNPKAIDAKLREAKATWSDVRDRASVRGTNVHERIFLALATGSAPPSLADLSEDERGYGQAAFAWWRDRKPSPVMAEQVTACFDKGFAGRFDLLADVERERFDRELPGDDVLDVRVLVDAKTREGGKARKSDHVQLPGYEDSNIACGIGPSDAQLVLILMPDGTYREEWCVGTREDFYAALVACQTGKSIDKRMREAGKAREVVTV
jgi:hypothetical protein